MISQILGYTGSISVQLYKDMVRAGASRLEFFRDLTYFMSVLGTVLLVASCLYFLRKSRPAYSARK